jgi:hypothetical protein
MMAYDKQLRDFTTMCDKEPIIYEGSMRRYLLIVIFKV